MGHVTPIFHANTCGGADAVPDKVEELDEDRRFPAVGAARLEYSCTNESVHRVCELIRQDIQLAARDGSIFPVQWHYDDLLWTTKAWCRCHIVRPSGPSRRSRNA